MNLYLRHFWDLRDRHFWTKSLALFFLFWWRPTGPRIFLFHIDLKLCLGLRWFSFMQIQARDETPSKAFCLIMKTLRNWYFFNPKKVTVQQNALSPAELHDKCNLEEISPELKCDVLDAFLICRPLQCGTDDRFRCDCNVNHGWVPYWQIMGTKYKQSDITQRHSRKQNPIKLEKFYLRSLSIIQWNKIQTRFIWDCWTSKDFMRQSLSCSLFISTKNYEFCFPNDARWNTQTFAYVEIS